MFFFRSGLAYIRQMQNRVEGERREMSIRGVDYIAFKQRKLVQCKIRNPSKKYQATKVKIQNHIYLIRSENGCVSSCKNPVWFYCK